MAKQSKGSRRGLTTGINIGYSAVLGIVAVVLLGQVLAMNSDTMIEVSLGMLLGVVVSSVAGAILKKSLVITLLTSTGILVVTTVMIFMQVDFSGL